MFSNLKIRETINNSKDSIPNKKIYDDETCYNCKCFADTSLGKFIIKNFKNDNLNELIYPTYEDPFASDEKNKEAKNEYLKNNHKLLFELGIGSLHKVITQIFFDSKNNIKLWSDVETVIELLITRDKNLKTKYKVSDDDLPEWDNNTLESFSDGLDLFEILLTKYFSEIQNIDITKDNAKTFFDDIVNNHIESLSQRSRGILKKDKAKELLDISKADIIINYNYTNIAKRLFEEIHSSEQEVKIVHINGSIEPKFDTQNEFETNIVVGYTNFCDEDVSKDLYPFEKICRRIIKNTEYVDINDRIENSWFDLVIIGHSCGMADSDVLGKLLCNPKLNNAVILCHTKNDLLSNFNNVKKIIDSENNKREKKNNQEEGNIEPNTFSELMSYTEIIRHVNDDKPAKNLFFAVEHSEEETANPEEAGNPEENTESADTTKKYKVKLALCLLGACLLFILVSCMYLV